MSIHKIVGIINTGVDSVLKDKRFKSKVLHGIASLYEVEEKNMPYVVSDDGEGTYAGIDDANVVSIYHKNNGDRNKPVPNTQQFGNGNGNDSLTKVYDMSMIVYGQRNKIKLNAEDLSNLILTGLPSGLSKTEKEDFKLKGCSINYVATGYNAPEILQREYKGQNNFKIEPNIILFEFKYSVECTFLRSCLETICCN